MAATARRTGVAPLVALLVTYVLGLSACTPDGQPPEPEPTKTKSASVPDQLTFGVYGAEPEITAYTKIATDFTTAHPDIVVNIKPYATHDEAMAALDGAVAAKDAPDVFLIAREDMPSLLERKATQPLEKLLFDRNVDFGDGYARQGLEAFSADNSLQCMPNDVSPLVVYYNTSLIDLTKVVERKGDKPPTPESGWRLDDFARAAALASTKGTKGVYIDPSLRQLAPFIWSGGGSVVDDVSAPKTLTLSDGDSQAALEQLLEVVRNPALTFNEKQLARKGALARFKAGKLGMILGFRSLTPQLRNQPGLSFDVMPLPRVGKTATVSVMSGLCVAATSEHTDDAADFVAYAVGDDAATVLARTGYVMPANLAVTHGDAFLQPGEAPASAFIFEKAMRYAGEEPYSLAWPQVEDMAEPLLAQLFYEPVIDPLEDRLKAIDDASAPLFVPPDPSGSPTSGASSSSTD